MNDRKRYAFLILLILFLAVFVSIWKNNKNDSVDKDKNAGNEQEYVNPYAEYTETFSGCYLYDIYEANRGSSADGDWFIDGSERFTYYKTYNFDESRNIKWCIELAEMKGADNLAEEFNNYHNDLFESRKEKMEKSQEKVMGMNVDELDISLEQYGDQIYTRASFWWGNIFTVVDIVDPHYRGCYTVIANFNSVSGKQYELGDLFCVDNYTEELIDVIKEQLGGYENGWNIELESPEELSFVIGYQGLLLIDNTSARSILIGWNELKNILSQEILNELNTFL